MIQYRVRISQTQEYGNRVIYGGSGVNKDKTEQLGALLWVRVDDVGETVTIQIDAKGEPGPKTVGKLRPGECFMLALDGVQRIYTSAEDKYGTDVLLECVILTKK